MNNIAIAGGYAYNANSQALGPYANIKFGMWYPVFSFGVSQVGRNETSNDQNYKIKNGQINAGISIPTSLHLAFFTSRDCFIHLSYGK
jgi:hypothetical protein